VIWSAWRKLTPSRTGSSRSVNPSGLLYSGPPFGGPEAMLAYLSRYTHRVAISNHRLVSADANTVAFRWKDYRVKDGDHQKIMRQATVEFIRRFLIHVLPSLSADCWAIACPVARQSMFTCLRGGMDGCHRIRHYGLLASGVRKTRLAKVRALLCVQPPEQAAIRNQAIDTAAYVA
jgi:hypothetical protein